MLNVCQIKLKNESNPVKTVSQIELVKLSQIPSKTVSQTKSEPLDFETLMIPMMGPMVVDRMHKWVGS